LERAAIYCALSVVADDIAVSPIRAAAMAAISREENVINLAEARAVRRAGLPVSLEMDWTKLHAESEPWALGRTIWFTVVLSAALWAIIAGALWFV
jgi:hypothetical protein